MSEYLTTSSQPKICQHARNCSGCFYFREDFISSLDLQRNEKTEFFYSEMRKQFVSLENTPLEYQNPHPLFYRNHLDFTLENGKMGLYHPEKRMISDISECLVLHPKLLDFYQSFRKYAPQDMKGSFRLRFDGHQGFGVWLDFANLDIKNLLDDKRFLQSLLEISSVEVGQRGKSVKQQGDQLKLVDPIYRHWFKTKSNQREIPLNSLVRSFTQSGLENNFDLINQIQIFYHQHGVHQKLKALEMGSGIGNLTFPFLDFFPAIDCIEFDNVSLGGLRLTLQEQGISENQVRLIQGDYHRNHSIHEMGLDDYGFLILNPARSGVGNFLEKLQTNQSVKSVFLMSCYTESFARDAALIQKAGFHCDKIVLFDQFSMSKHFEILSFWSR